MKIFVLLFVLTACSTSGEPDYRSAYGVPPLEVPPSLCRHRNLRPIVFRAKRRQSELKCQPGLG